MDLPQEPTCLISAANNHYFLNMLDRFITSVAVPVIAGLHFPKMDRRKMQCTYDDIQIEPHESSRPSDQALTLHYPSGNHNDI
jgi:hypothetical protein